MAHSQSLRFLGFRLTCWGLGLVLIGFPLLQFVFTRAGSARQGGGAITVSDWLIFMGWIVLIEWTLFLVLKAALKKESRSLGDAVLVLIP